MRVVRGAAVAVAISLTFAASDALAFTENLGATSFPDTGEATGCFSEKAGAPCSSSWALINVPEGIAAQPSGDGVITSWRVRAHIEGAGTVRLAVLRPNADGSYTAAAISEPATDTLGNPNPTSLPIKTGYYIAATTSSEGPFGSADIFGLSTAAFAASFPGFTQFEQTLKPTALTGFIATEIGAQVVLAPQATSLSPASGPAAGGTVITIKGKYLSDATQVLFGSAPATGLKSEELETLRATAPPGAAGSTVDVRVVGPGGTSSASAAMRFTYAAPTLPSTLPTPPPTLGALAETNRVFAAGSALTPLTGSTSLLRKRGTVFSFTLDRPASVAALISRVQPGRRVHGGCVAPRKVFAHKPRCTRSTTVARLTRTGHAGPNKLAFSGRLKGRVLRPGSYQARFVATNATGPSAPATISFSIVAR